MYLFSINLFFCCYLRSFLGDGVGENLSIQLHCKQKHKTRKYKEGKKLRNHKAYNIRLLRHKRFGSKKDAEKLKSPREV